MPRHSKAVILIHYRLGCIWRLAEGYCSINTERRNLVFRTRREPRRTSICRLGHKKRTAKLFRVARCAVCERDFCVRVRMDFDEVFGLERVRYRRSDHCCLTDRPSLRQLVGVFASSFWYRGVQLNSPDFWNLLAQILDSDPESYRCTGNIGALVWSVITAPFART